MKIRQALLTGLIAFTAPVAWAANIPVPVATDSRIKTMVYSENDVFSVVAHFGYQSNIEFAKNEEIETISVGNRMGWQIVTSGRRMFIRPTLANARTNMTVITSKRAYQFDLVAVSAVYSPHEELSYVIRFYYPDEKSSIDPLSSYEAEPSGAHSAAGYPVSSVPAGSASMASAPVQGGAGGENYNYSYTGEESLAPLKVYDDGAATYFKFAPAVSSPRILALVGGKEVALNATREGEFWVVSSVGSQFVVRDGDKSACIFNEGRS